MLGASEKAQNFVAAANGNVVSLNNMTKASKAAVIGMNLLSTAANMAVSFGISMLIQGLFQVISASNDIRQQAQEVGSAFNSTESDINSYKERVQELHDTINDSQSSFQDITDARKELYSIQSEMVDKYGNEVGAIEAITKAVDVQSQYVNKAAESWAKLTDTQWQASKNDFNRTTFWKRISNAISGYSNNIDRMESEYGKYRSRINLSTFADPNTEEFEKFKELLEKNYGATFSVDDNNSVVATLSGNADEVYNKLLEIQNLADTFHFNDAFNNSLTDSANSAKDVADNYREMYNNYVLQEKIFKDKDYAKSFNSITDAYEQYQKAIESNDEDQINNAKEKYAEAMSDAMALATKNGDEDVLNAFKNLYPELQAEVANWQFTFNFNANTDGMKEEIQSAIATLKGNGYTIDDVQDKIDSAEYVNLDDGKEKDAFETLKKYTDDYNVSVSDLNNNLAKRNQLETSNYQQAVEKFGRDVLENHSEEDLDILFGISEEDIDAALRKFKTKEEAFVALINDAKKAMQLDPTTKSGMIDLINSMSDGFDSLDKVYADVLNGGSFDFTNLDTKKFSEAFSGLEDEYTKFIETVSSSPTDINACQSAFNELADAYITNKGILSNVTEETKDLTIAMLENMGVENAAEVVKGALNYQEEQAAINKLLSANASFDLANATDTEVLSLMNEASQYGVTTEALFYYLLQKQLANGNPILTDVSCSNLLLLAQNAGVTGDVVDSLNQLMVLHNQISQATQNGDALLTSYLTHQAEELTAKIKSQAAQFQTSVKPIVKYTGGVDTAAAKQKKLKDATSSANKALKKQKEELEKQKKVLDKQKEKYDDLCEAVNWFYEKQTDKLDKQIDKLNDANDALNDQKDTYDDILDAIDKVYEAQINAIQERIDALDEANDEEEKALELEKARQALEDARHKKNIKVYTKGKGFVYTVDESAIKNAEDDYNKLVDEMQKDEIKKALEDQIEALNKLRDTFADIPNAWKDAMNKLKASEMFGSNWEIDILNPSDDLINNFRNQYTGTQDQIQSNENKIDSLEAEKERIEELKQLWEDAKNAYKYSQYEAKLSSFFGSDYEYQLLNNSAAWRGKFIEEYSSVCAQIEALEQQIKNLENESAESASSAADSTSEALGKTSNAIRDASNTAKDNSIGKYLWGQEDDAALTAAKLRLMDLNDQLSKGANDDLVNAKNAVQNFITEWANLKNTGEVTDGLTQSINNLQIADGDYFEKYGNVIGNVKDRLSESAQYTNNAAQCVKDASGNIELLNQQLATLNTSTDNVEATADQAVSDTGVTIDGSLEKITALKDAMGELVTAKAELQSAIDESVTDVSDVITASGDKVTTIQDQVTVLLDNIDRLNDAMANLADKMSTLDDVTLDSVCNALGAADGSTGLIGSINSVITAINGENGLIVQLGAVNTASLEEITLGFGSEDGVGLLGAVQNVNNAIYVEDSEECLIGKINKIAETITTIDSASNAFLIMRANILLAEAEVQKLIDLINSIPEEKHTYHYIHTVNVGEATGTALTGYASGTATPSGSSYVRGTGNWGLPQDEKKAAVAEIGREILLRDGQYFVIDKPQLMDLKKGDIIFNHAQTESILKNGKNSRINEFAKLGEPVAEKLHKQGNSFTDGTLPKGWRKVDIFEDLRNSGAVYDMDKFDAAVMKMKTDPESIKTMMYNPNNMPDWNKFVSSGQTVNTTNNNQQTSVTYQFNGDLSFPNITNGDDAKKFINEIQHLPTRARQYVNRH